MEHTSEKTRRERWESARACLERLCPPAEGARRAAVAADGGRRLAEYRAYLADLEREGGGGGCAGLRGSLAERAFEAESELRVSLAEGVRSLNDLKDSGMLHLQLAELARSLEAGETDLSAMIRESREQLQRAFDLPPAFVDEIQQVAERRLESLRYDRESDVIVVRRRSPVDGEPEEVRLRLGPRAGDMGRISLEQFFGADGRVAIQAGPPTAPPGDCHQRSGMMPPPLSMDAYAATLASRPAARRCTGTRGRSAGATAPVCKRATRSSRGPCSRALSLPC